MCTYVYIGVRGPRTVYFFPRCIAGVVCPGFRVSPCFRRRQVMCLLCKVLRLLCNLLCLRCIVLRLLCKDVCLLWKVLCLLCIVLCLLYLVLCLLCRVLCCSCVCYITNADNGISGVHSNAPTTHCSFLASVSLFFIASSLSSAPCISMYC